MSPREKVAVRKKRADVKTTSQFNRRNPTNINAQKLKNAQKELTEVYLKEQKKIHKNQAKSMADGKRSEQKEEYCESETESYPPRRTNTPVETTFKNLFGKLPKATQEPIMKIIINQRDIKLEQFTQEELDSVLKKGKNKKAVVLDEIPLQIWKTREFYYIQLRHYDAVYNQNTINRWTKRCIHRLPKKRDLGIAKNYRGITFKSIVIHDLQCSTTQPHRTENWEDT